MERKKKKERNKERYKDTKIQRYKDKKIQRKVKVKVLKNSINHNQSTSIRINQHQSASISINQHQSASINFNLHSILDELGENSKSPSSRRELLSELTKAGIGVDCNYSGRTTSVGFKGVGHQVCLSLFT